MSVINTQPLVGASGQSTGPYTLSKSLRFRASASAYLNRTPATTSNLQTWTFSAWVKRGALGGNPYVFCGMITGGSTNQTNIQFGGNVTDDLTIFSNSGGTTQLQVSTSAVYRDPAAWYHIVAAIDTTQATASNRVKLYVNGSQVTALAVSTYPAQNANLNVNSVSSQHFISSYLAASRSGYYDGYMTNINFIDGQQLTPTSFGETDSSTGVWKPKAYSGTYGTNGFYLKFADATSTSTLGNDSSGNGNTWTTNNISVTAGATYDSMTDVPTLTSATAANYCVMNPLDYNASNVPTIVDGNLKYTTNSAIGARSTIAMSSGKWYCEVNVTSTGNMLGIISSTASLTGVSYPGSTSAGYGYYSDNGNKYNNGANSAYGSTYGNSDVIGIAFDADAGTLTYYKNNTSQGTAFSSIPSGSYSFVFGNGASTGSFNFGQRPFAYTPPSGYVALNTYNLSTPTIAAGNKYMDATLYTGTLLSNSITNAASFKPDLVWVKSRSAATDHKLTDSVRGVTKGLISNTQGVETTDTQGLTAINSNGFTVGTDTNYNNLTATYVAWQWQAGQGSTSSNTSGSITSTVSVNASAGFSIVTYTGNNTAGATIGHGLGVKPNLIIIKNKNVGTTNWLTYSSVLGATKFLKIESTDSAGTSILPFNNTEPTSSVFSVGAWDVPNGSGNSHIAYCWTEIAGFSKFGSYTGNGSSDGPFIYTGFRPKFILYKCSSTTGNWILLDSVRSNSNVASARLLPNTSDSEASGTHLVDFLSNGFKLRNIDANGNGSGSTYVYAAFAETPTKFANAR